MTTRCTPCCYPVAEPVAGENPLFPGFSPLGAISRAFQPGCKFEIMLCLVGGQGAGKSTFFRLLAVRDEWFSDDLRKLDDDNVYRKLQGHRIIEMSEMMATANAKSIEEIKSLSLIHISEPTRRS